MPSLVTSNCALSFQAVKEPKLFESISHIFLAETFILGHIFVCITCMGKFNSHAYNEIVKSTCNQIIFPKGLADKFSDSLYRKMYICFLYFTKQILVFYCLQMFLSLINVMLISHVIIINICDM